MRQTIGTELLEEIDRTTRRAAVHTNVLIPQQEGLAMEIKGEGAVQLTNDALMRLSSMVGIPQNFLPNCSPALAATVLAEFMGRTGRGIDALISNAGDTLQIASYSWEDNFYIPPSALLAAVRRADPDHGYDITRAKAGIKGFTVFVTEADAFAKPDGHALHLGVAYQGSMDGTKPTKLSASIYRPRCTNGAYTTEAAWTLPRTARTPALAMMAMTEGFMNLLESRDQMKSNVERMAQRKIENPLDHLAHTVRRLGIPDRHLRTIEHAYLEEPEPTEWGITNAITRAANDATDDNIATTLWEAGGRSVSRPGAPCRVCGHSGYNAEPHA